MGLGKTEAALYAAYQLMEKGAATGIYFALPTQLTSDKIHERVNQFLQCILEEDSSHKHSFLVHGNAWLKQFDMGEEGNPGGAWFAQGKRSILAPFAVGTIDQALMSVMNVKHGFVRTFGLAGKVVILDEVHSYDSYTGALLDALVKALRQLHCTVIILSATLTQERRGKLLGFTPASMQYPLITAQPNQAELAELAVVTIPDVTVKIQHHQKDRPALAEALLRAESGQQVLWIENTVKEAQDIYRELAARSKEQDTDCGLLHSRFTKNHRAENEGSWVTFFGKSGKSIRNRRGRILVGTQVLEQSLDIDADFLVTRIAPTDMLLQRLGRLWRHLDTIRPAGASREAWILSPELKFGVKDPEGAFGSSAKVYAPYILCRTLAVWNNVSKVALPSQIRTLIEDTYAKKIETGDMLKHLTQVKDVRARLEQMALHGLSKGGNTLSEESAKTRYSEQESTDVLLIKAYQPDAKSHGVWVTLLSDERLWVPTNGRSLSRDAWRNISAKLMLDTLKVADYLAPKALNRAQLSWLGDYFYLGKPEYKEDTVMLRVALVNADESLRSLIGDRVNDQYKTSYNATQGYVTTKFK